MRDTLRKRTLGVFAALLGIVAALFVATAPAAAAFNNCSDPQFQTCYDDRAGDVHVPEWGHGTNGTDFLEADCPTGTSVAQSQIATTRHSDGTEEVGMAGAYWFNPNSAFGPQRFRVFARTLDNNGAWTLKADSGSVKQNYGHNVGYFYDQITVAGARGHEAFVVNIYYLGTSLDGSDGSYLCQTPAVTN